ncbi:MAG: hypothetical protein JST00_05300 [Deltaproteobacteria bacterium]|nr:hypothetical protein [Deltaproteobacteria bacterium]
MSGGRIGGPAATGPLPTVAAAPAPATPAAAVDAKVGAKATGDAKAAKKDKELAEAARQFEAIFVRSMLAQSGVAGKAGSYGDFAVDALAQNVTSGKGLGLAELIRRAVEKSHEGLKNGG